jgi:Kdo2-lipid IVA lauroyltransferase/acyltransferase
VESWVPKTPGEARRSHLESAFWRRFLIWGLRNVPMRLQDASMPLWSGFFYLQVPHIRRAIELNLRRLASAGGARRQLLAFRTFTNYCHCIARAYRLHAGAELSLPVETRGLEHLQAALAGGSGVILATGHLGSWQLGPYLLAEHRLPPVLVVMNQEPDRGAQQVEAGLRDQRFRIVYSNHSPMLGLELRAALGRGELVGLQMDRSPNAGEAAARGRRASASEGGLRVRCAGGEALFAAGPAQLARSCSAPVVPVFFPMEGGKVRIQLEEPLWSKRTADRQADLVELTQRLADVYGRMIQTYPDQWFNFYDFWGETR